MLNSIESKVIAATAGSGLGAAAGTFILWVLGVCVWHTPGNAEKAATAVAAVPTPVSAIVLLLITVAGAGLSGYLAPHTSRTPGAHSADAVVYTDPSVIPEPSAPLPVVVVS